MILELYAIFALTTIILLIAGIVLAQGWGKVTLLALNIPFLIFTIFWSYNIEKIGFSSGAVVTSTQTYHTLALFWSFIFLLNVSMLIIYGLKEGYAGLGKT